MARENEKGRSDARASRASRQARLHALLFTDAALGTTLLSFTAAGPKIPPFVGE